MADAAADISGVTAGAVAGFLAGDLGGAGMGAAAGTFLSRQLRAVVFEVLDRKLSLRERKRVVGLFGAAGLVVHERLLKGERLRNDGFFQQQLGERSSWQEIVEGTLIAAQREYEERKIKYMGYLLANFAFEEKMGRTQANLFLKIAGDLSYYSICTMHVVNRNKYDYEESHKRLDRLINKSNESHQEIIAV